MGLRLAAVLVLAATPVGYLQSHQPPGGGFAEPGGQASPQLTAWAVLGLRSAGVKPDPATLDYLVAHEAELADITDAELVAMAETVLGRRPEKLLTRIRRAQRPSGAIGPSVNSTVWGILALRQAREATPTRAVRYLLREQRPSGGWPWFPNGAPDSNDTAAALEALRAGGVAGRPVRRGLSYLRRLQNRDGGFELSAGRGSDAQSTSWAIQAFVAAGKPAPTRALGYLRRLERRDGSFRYSTRFTTTPVWVTAQVLPALARRPFPL